MYIFFTGGTIDITVHEVTSSGGLKEVHAASGGGWGGILVDEAFRMLLIDIVGKEVYPKFMKQETEDWIDLWRMFEFKKKTVDPASKDRINMKLPPTLMELYKEERKQDIRDRIAESKYSDKIHFAGGDKVRYDATLIQSLFKDSIDKTVAHVNSLLRDQNARDIKAILMVGGFSESPMLQVAIKKAFPRLKIIIPKEASSAILRGAVIFGHNPTSITQRVLKKTYGVKGLDPFDEAVHDERYKEQLDCGVMCTKIFTKHAEKGQSVKVGEALAEQWGSPADHNQEAIDISIYASDLKDPKYTDRGCQHVGTLEVDISDVPGDLDRDVSVSLSFGDTEIKAKARIERTGQVCTANFDFLG